MLQLSISIDVPDLEKATAFYVSALGCKNLRQDSEDIRVLRADNCDIYLLQRNEGTNPTLNQNHVRSYERHWTPVHLDFGVDDLESTLDRILKMGGKHEGSESGSWGKIEYCADPFGNGFCIIRENHEDASSGP